MIRKISGRKKKSIPHQTWQGRCHNGGQHGMQEGGMQLGDMVGWELHGKLQVGTGVYVVVWVWGIAISI